MNLQKEIANRDPGIDEQSLSARLNQFRDVEPVYGPRPIDLEYKQPRWHPAQVVPETRFSSLSIEKLRSAIATHGALIVRGLLDCGEVRYYRSIVDAVVDACMEQEAPEGQPMPRKSPFRNPPRALESLLDSQKLKNSRSFHRLSGSAMCVESASVAEELLATYEAKGLKELMTEYLGEPPCLSALKWVLRRSKLPVAEAGWHQDGAFMGSDINSLNMWIALDHCGSESGAPGLDVLPRRLTEIFSPGKEGAIFSWSVGEDDIRQAFGAGATCSPEFLPGDAFLFDHFYLHRTQYREHSSRPRYAIETWLFGSRNFPRNQVPLSW